MKFEIAIKVVIKELVEERLVKLEKEFDEEMSGELKEIEKRISEFEREYHSLMCEYDIENLGEDISDYLDSKAELRSIELERGKKRRLLEELMMEVVHEKAE